MITCSPFHTFIGTVVLALFTALVNLSAQPSEAPCSQLPWEASVTYNVQQWGNQSWHDASAVLSDALLPVTFGVPAALFAYAHVQTSSVTNGDVKRYTAESGIQLFTSEIATYVFVLAAKTIIDLERPFESYPDCITGYQQPLGSSFPSGHAAGTAALATTLCLRYPTWYVIVPSVSYALLTGLARLHLGVHYLSDVAAGYALGVGTALLVNALNTQLFSLTEPLMPSIPITTSHIGILTFSIPL